MKELVRAGALAALALAGLCLALYQLRADFNPLWLMAAMMFGAWLFKELSNLQHAVLAWRAPSRYAATEDIGGLPHRELWQPFSTVLGSRPYRVVDRRVGGLGVVYFVVRGDGSALVLKTLRPDLSADASLRRVFAREVRILRDLPDHPAILKALPIEIIEGSVFAVLPWIGFPDCDASLACRLRQGALPIPFALDVAMSCAMAMGAACEAIPGLVHRDIKPGNILLDGEQAKLVDFGLARVAAEATQHLSQAAGARPGPVLSRVEGSAGVGTLPYMAPEQCTGAAVGKWTDVYAIGAVLYEMLTGHWLFDAPTAGQYLECILGREPVLPSTLRRDIPLPVEELVMTCLRKPPEERFTTMEQLWQALEEAYIALTGRPLFIRMVSSMGWEQRPFYTAVRQEWGALSL